MLLKDMQGIWKPCKLISCWISILLNKTGNARISYLWGSFA